MTPATSLAETFARLSAVDAGGLDLYARVGLPEGKGWTVCAGLARDDALLEDLLGRVGRACGTEDRAVTGSLFLRGYLWRILVPAVAAFLVNRRMPDVGASNVALGFDENGGTIGLAFLGGRFAALRSDPEADAADVTVVGGEDEMLAWAVERLAEAHLPGLFAALGRHGVRRASRALWGMVADLVAEAFAWVGPALGQESEARAFAESILDGSPPISGTANFFAPEHDGGSGPARVRNACCLYYRVGAAACLTCPRTARGVQRRVRAWEKGMPEDGGP